MLILDIMLQVVGIIGECAKDINMLAYLKDKSQQILLDETESELYGIITDVSELEILIVSSEIDINKPHTIIDKAKKKNVQIMSNIDALYMFKKPKTIAVTGSYNTRIVGQMISHAMSKCGIDHYMSMSETFKWPENIDAVEYMIIVLQNYQLKPLDLFYAQVTCVTNVTMEQTEGKHIQEYLSNIKHVLELSQHKVINAESESNDLLKYFDDALTSEPDVTVEMLRRYSDVKYTTAADHETVNEWRSNPLKMKLSLLTATVLQSIAHNLQDGEYMFLRVLNALHKFKMNGHMHVIFQNEELMVIDDHKATNVEQVIYDMGFLPEDANVLLLCPEPKNTTDWLKLKNKNCIERLNGLVLYDSIISALMPKMEFATRVVNAVDFEKACKQMVNMFNKTKKRPIVVMYVNGTEENAQIFHKLFEEYVTEEVYEEEEELEEEFADWS